MPATCQITRADGAVITLSAAEFAALCDLAAEGADTLSVTLEAPDESYSDADLDAMQQRLDAYAKVDRRVHAV